MSFKYLALDGLQLLTYTRESKFYCHDEINNCSYYESVTEDELKQRVRKLNKRIQFPINVLRETLFECQPVEASLEGGQAYGAEVENDVVLHLKYRVKDAPASLKWEWYLTPMERAEFYRGLMMLTLGHTVSLGNCQEYLMAIIEQKDKEIQQYRNEGALLRRTTVATKLFDVNGFLKQCKPLLHNVVSYGQCVHAHGESVLTFSPNPSTMELESPNGTSAKPADVATTADNGAAANALSPRNRKRKAMEAGIQHVERKALQRRRITQMEYKNTESQEEEQERCPFIISPDGFSADEIEDNILESGLGMIKPEVVDDDDVDVDGCEIHDIKDSDSESKDYNSDDGEDTLNTSLSNIGGNEDKNGDEKDDEEEDEDEDEDKDEAEDEEEDLNDSMSNKEAQDKSDEEPEDKFNTSSSTIESEEPGDNNGDAKSTASTESSSETEENNQNNTNAL